jgi:hypothetical protein
MTLRQILGLHKTVGDFGIEIEVEGTEKIVDDPRWKSDRDGSLRGANREYILHRPIPREDVRDALSCLAAELEYEPIDFSFRTSVHVHVNVQELTYVQLLNMIYTYLLIEEPLMTYCGKERKGNRFCLRLQDAEGMLETFTMLFKGQENALGLIPRDMVRYAAINIESVIKYGSLEFRAMRGNLDVEYITTWTEALYRIREFAKHVENPAQIYELFASEDPKSFLKRILGDVYHAFIYPKMVEEIQRSFSLSLDLPYAYKASIELAKDKKKPMKKEIDIALKPIWEFPADRLMNPVPEVPL